MATRTVVGRRRRGEVVGRHRRHIWRVRAEHQREQIGQHRAGDGRQDVPRAPGRDGIRPQVDALRQHHERRMARADRTPHPRGDLGPMPGAQIGAVRRRRPPVQDRHCREARCIRRCNRVHMGSKGGEGFGDPVRAVARRHDQFCVAALLGQGVEVLRLRDQAAQAQRVQQAQDLRRGPHVRGFGAVAMRVVVGPQAGDVERPVEREVPSRIRGRAVTGLEQLAGDVACEVGTQRHGAGSGHVAGHHAAPAAGSAGSVGVAPSGITSGIGTPRSRSASSSVSRGWARRPGIARTGMPWQVRRDVV